MRSVRMVAVVMLIGSAGAAGEPVRVGEPYELAGKRLVFTNWIYVRPGDVGWTDASGKMVNADESVILLFKMVQAEISGLEFE
jgi:hypothetical protein